MNEDALIVDFAGSGLSALSTAIVRRRNQEMAEDIKKLEEKEIEKVSGGGWMDKYKDEEYDAAGITILKPGWAWNEEYYLRNSKEYIDEDLANEAVEFYKRFGRSVSCTKEIYYFRNTRKALW